ncbi:hypothetical protein LK09_01110 [Microbacterium mangrovi]|uniref:Guanylate cyclase domain-containing protein n=1 Tax=Microbacterium mangrovi TaxID=1348253 RepID=A0A0B2A9V2_9MICO|nr:adenylate/guanylate cyclase domain-containing protein [Microbacterium mangrovi]KHK99949.1 hypothetical protein LK09_01110 [Microbacterium mangrovi]
MSRDPQHAGVDLRPFVPRVVAEWLAAEPQRRHRRVPGTMVFADISGFTKLTERLARRGRVGAELLSDTLDHTFGTLLAPAFADGADLLKWGGDAVLLLYRGDEHAARAAHASHGMRSALRELVRSRALPVPAPLRMSIGIHSGRFDLFFVGDPLSHRELIVAGPDVSRLALIEQACSAGQILLSAETAALLPARVRGGTIEVDGSPARLLRSSPQPDAAPPDDAAPAVPVADTLPPVIRERLLAGRGEPEHRPISVGFVQFSGTDALIAEGDDEAAADAVQDMVVAVQRACLQRGVTFFESDLAADGGKIMLTAGAPRSAGRDAERMLRAAHDIAAHAGRLGIRVGVNTGHVFAGELGPAVRRTYSIKGDAVNLAARLLGRAQPGQAVATARVVDEARIAVDTEALAPFLVKGKRDPVHAVIVRDVSAGTGAAWTETRFVGREEELTRLRHALTEAVDGRGTVIDLVGEPGIGKSRLVAELAVPAGMPQLTTAVSSYETATPYAAIGILLRQVLGIGPHDTPDAAATRLEDAVRTRAAELEPWLPLLGVPLDLDLPSTREVDELEERFRRGRIEEVTIALLGALLTEPAVLVFEDAHLMDEASGALLHRFEDEVQRQPWLVIVTRRYIPVGYVPGLEGERDTRITLGGMPPERALELLESAAGASRPSRHTLEAMAERAAGNPLFLASLAANVHAAEGEDDLPGSVEALLLVDIDRLTLADRTLLRLAAVLGARFEADILARLHADADAASPLAVDEIASRLNEFVRPADGGILEFRHAMVRDVAYAGLPFRQRRQMHERVATTLESLGDRTAGPDLLSLHFHAAGLHEKAWSASLQAAAEARAKYAYAQAATFFARALDSATHLPEVTPGERSAASVSLGECLDMAGDANGALAALRRARRDLHGDVVRSADVMHKEARITLRLGRYRATLAELTRAMRVLDGIEGNQADTVRARIANRYGFCLHLQNRGDEAVRWGHASVEFAEASADLEVLADAYNALHLSYAASTMPEERPYGQLALGLYEQLDDLSGQAHTLNNLAIDTYNDGDWNGAIDAFARAAESFHRLGDDANEANALYNRAEVLVAQGRHDEALPVVTAALHLARRVDDEELVGLALREQARAASGTGDPTRAGALFAEARAVLAGLDLASEVALLDAAHAEALADAGDPDQALALLDRAIAAAAAKASETLARLHRIRAQALVRQGSPELAAAAAREGLTHTMGAHGGYEPALLRLALAEATGDETLREESRRALAALGVVA